MSSLNLGARGYRETPLSDRSTAQNTVDSGGTRGGRLTASKSGSRPAISLTCRSYGGGGACERTGYGRRGHGEFDLEICCCTFSSVISHSFSQRGAGLGNKHTATSATLSSITQHSISAHATRRRTHNTSRHETQECSMDTRVLVRYGAPVAFRAPGVRAPEQAWGLELPPSTFTQTALHAKAAALRAATSGQIQTSRSVQSRGQRMRSRSLLTSSAAYLHWRLAKRGGL